ncbi:MAG: hypothetical protein K0R29_2817 [Pseudobdellovibrio sp.]|jgi:hypothetical protein|nr:hypothetical protein [Pseudobdellovibrio sp.]
MKNLIVITIATLTTLSTFAKEVVCVDRRLQDATIAATFQLDAKGSSVSLFVPTGETSGEVYKGECRRDEGAIELAITCNVMTSTDSGYEVRLFSFGGPQLGASVAQWSMAGKGEAWPLPCDKSE